MNKSVCSLSLDLHRAAAPAVLTVTRGDTARALRITLVEDGKPYEITSLCAAALCADLPGGADAVALTIEGNVLTAAVPGTWCASAGEIRCEVRVYDKDANVVTSPRFSIIVSDTLFPDDSAEVYYGLLATPVVSSIHRPWALASLFHIKAGTESKTYYAYIGAEPTEQLVVVVPKDYKNTVVPTFTCEGSAVTPSTAITNLCDRFGVKQGYKYYTVANQNVSVEWTVTIPTATEGE